MDLLPEAKKLRRLFRSIHPKNSARNQARLWQVLVEISLRPDVTTDVLISRTELHRSTIWKITSDLMNKGAITIRKSCPENTIIAHFTATPAGIESINKVAAIFQAA